VKKNIFFLKQRGVLRSILSPPHPGKPKQNVKCPYKEEEEDASLVLD
jgi:hypothetical protein